MFPMNLMGAVGNGYFAFGLNSSRAAAPLVERARRVVLSSVPLEQAPVVAKLGSNHRKPSIDWSQLPFAIVRPNTIDAPVAVFALTVREMQVEVVRRLGSHTLFVARTIAEERLADGPTTFQRSRHLPSTAAKPRDRSDMTPTNFRQFGFVRRSYFSSRTNDPKNASTHIVLSLCISWVRIVRFVLLPF